MRTEFYSKLKSPITMAGSNPLDELKVSIDQYKGGYNYATGNYEESGIKIFFKPIHRGGCFSSSILIGNVLESGFKIHALDAKRKSQKKIDKVADAIKPLLDKFGEIWGQENFPRTIYNMVMEAIKNMPK